MPVSTHASLGNSFAAAKDIKQHCEAVRLKISGGPERNSASGAAGLGKLPGTGMRAWRRPD